MLEMKCIIEDSSRRTWNLCTSAIWRFYTWHIRWLNLNGGIFLLRIQPTKRKLLLALILRFQSFVQIYHKT